MLACHAAMGMGTLFGGWRIVKTMGMKITKLKPVGGFCAETGGAITLFVATHSAIPVSHHAHDHRRDRRRGRDASSRPCAGASPARIVWAWILTIPCSAFISALTWLICHLTLAHR